MKDPLEPQWHMTPEFWKGNKRRPTDLLRKFKSAGTISILVIVVTFWVVMSTQPRPFSANPNPQANLKSSPPIIKPELPVEIQVLVQKLKHARMVAEKANPNATSYTELEREAWHRANPCISRGELGPLYNERRHSDILKEHPYLGEVLSEYSKLHRACMQNVGQDPVEFFLRKDSTSGCKFVVGDNEVGTGIGNKILSAAAQVMYAILTQRVLLIPMSTSIPRIMCEPFEGSSWRITTDDVLTPGKHHAEHWRHVAEINAGVDGLRLGWDNVTAIYAARVSEDWDCQPEKRFFCDAEQEFYDTHVTWMYFSECLYYLPKLFAVPRFRPTLEALFPDRMVLTHLLRTVLLPTDPVWLRVQQLNHVHLKHVDHRVGIQARYFHGKEEYDLLHTATEKAVAQCLLENHLLPNTSLSNTLNSKVMSKGSDDLPWVENGDTPVTTYLLFITSLYDGLKDHLTKIYIRNPSRTREAVGIVQLTHEDRQQFGVEVDRQALAEVLGLSLCDELIVTPQSTFGAIAAAYGGVVPWFVDIRPNTTSPGCVRAISVDACYQLPSSKHYTCPHDKSLDNKLIADVVPYIHDCHPVETPYSKVHGAGLGFLILSGYNRTVESPLGAPDE